MFKKFFSICSIAMLLFNYIAEAQNGWLPPVNFPSGKNVCDDSPWKLVFYDNFNGTKIDTNKWYTFNTNNRGTSDDWCEGRLPYPDNYSIIRDANAVVSNGTLKLKVKQQTNTWQCATCDPDSCTSGYGDNPVTRNYTSGYISSKTTYDNGKFEARLKMPIFEHSWATCWLAGYVDEIDFAEASVKNGSSTFEHLFSSLPHTSFNLHAWQPNPNPYNLPDQTKASFDYPNQSWWDWNIWNDHFHQEDWHVYLTEWDTAKLRFYVDGSEVQTIWKYRQQKSRTLVGGLFHHFLWHYWVGSGCLPSAGTWEITKGFPFNNNSDSKLIFSTAMMEPNKVLDSEGELGQMEIDYVKVWQRHPEDDGHTDLCQGDQTPIVTGPNTLCYNETYMATPAVSGGFWEATSGAIVTNSWINGNIAYADIAKPTNNWANFMGSVTYYYPSGPEGCPFKQSHHLFSCLDIPGHQYNVVVYTSAENKGMFNLFIPKINLMDTSSRFEWNISYISDKSDTQNIQKVGRFVSTPAFLRDDVSNYYLHWNVKMIKLDGQVVSSWEGQRTNNDSYGQQNEDTALYFYDAVITDTAAYLKDAENRLSKHFFPVDVSTETVDNIIEKAKAEALAPYIIDPETGKRPIDLYPQEKNTTNISDNDTKIFPNPTSNNITIQPGGKFVHDKLILITIHDLLGRIEQSKDFHYVKGDNLNLLLSGLTNGVYIMELKQGNYIEYHKIIKIKDK